MTLYFSHGSSYQHDTGEGHPECAARLDAIEKAVTALELKNLTSVSPNVAVEDDVLLAHKPAYFEQLVEVSKRAQQARQYLDPDTVMSAGSLEAALYAAGATVQATADVVKGKDNNAFCASRPPGHHATAQKAMGFCLLNSVAIAAKYAVQELGLARVAVIDFDVHHGNGTEDIFWQDNTLFYGSTHGLDHFPFSGGKDEGAPSHICNAPLYSGNDGSHFKEAMREKVLPALIAFRPDMIFISAGFDAHKEDPLASLNLIDDDFYWITLKLAEIADKYCQGRMVSTLEGGYNLDVIGGSVATHVKALAEASS